MPQNISPSINNLQSLTIYEGSIFSTNGSFTDPDSTSWTAIVDYGDGTGAQSLELTAMNFSLNHVYIDNGTYTVLVNITDNQGATGSASSTVTVNNATPSVGIITTSLNPVQVNVATSVSSNFTDPGVLDTHNAVWNWGDGTSSVATISETNGSGSITGTHTYTVAGVYEIILNVTDNDGGSSTQTFQYLSVYNPTPQGLFSAGQKFISPPGAFSQNPNATGNVLFGLSYKYQGDIPVGNRQFTMDFISGNFEFNATSVTSLIISNGLGTLRGSGTVNGQGTYTYLVVGKEGANTIRIQIQDSFGNSVYDTQPTASDTSEPTTSVTAGNVLAH
jgi:hypothetical protein